MVAVNASRDAAACMAAACWYACIWPPSMNPSMPAMATDQRSELPHGLWVSTSAGLTTELAPQLAALCSGTRGGARTNSYSDDRAPLSCHQLHDRKSCHTLAVAPHGNVRALG